jgi:hypothetical protein
VAALLIAGSVVLAILNQSITWAISRKWRTAWLALMAAQIPNSAYDIVTRQYGFVAVSASACCIALTAWRRWGADG